MLGGRGKNKAKVDPKSITKFSKGQTDVPKGKQKEKPGGKSGKVETFKPDPRVVAEVNKIKKRNPNAKVKWNKDGSADVTNN